MAKENISGVGAGGAGFQGSGPGSAAAAIKELQGLKINVVAGSTAGTKLDVAAIREEDTILAALVEDTTSGIISADDSANLTIASTRATGTLTLSGLPTADDTVTVNGVVYTFVAEPAAATDVLIGADENDTGDSLAAAINAVEGAGLAAVTAESDGAGVVTVTSVVDGAGNGPTVTDTGSTITISNTDPGAVTATIVSAGNNDAITINGVAFTIKTTPTDLNVHMADKATDALQAAEVVRIVNRYQTNVADLGVVVTATNNVVTISPKAARAGNIITLTEDADNTAASGSGFLAGGTATGGVVSETNLTGKALILFWYDKR